MNRPVITLLTDFGTQDHYVGAMKGVMLGICPEAQLVDITHEVAPFAIAGAAWTLGQAWRCFPAGTVHLVVVDPGVGGARSPILVEAGGHWFVGPDNGVFSMVYGAAPGHVVREISNERYFRMPVSRTFHGRDVFAPVAAQLAGGVAGSEFGDVVKEYVQTGAGGPVAAGADRWTGVILNEDRFGNLVTNFDQGTWRSRLLGGFELRVGSGIVSRLALTYSDVSGAEPFAIFGSAGFLEISVNQGSAAVVLGARVGSGVELSVRSATEVAGTVS